MEAQSNPYSSHGSPVDDFDSVPAGPCPHVERWLSIPWMWDFYSEVFRSMRGDWLAMLSTYCSTLIGIPVVVLLHTPLSRDWFRARAAGH